MPPFLSTKRKNLPLHKAVQEVVLSHIPSGEGFLEQPLPGHFADVAWLKMGLIFEIQCSSIRVQEVEKRIKDYNSFGYQVVWILHQKLFNQRFLSPSELYLREKGICYFTNITIDKQGIIYDQFEKIQGLTRTYRSSPFPVDVGKPLLKKGKLSFSGDRHGRLKEAPKQKNLLLSLYDKVIFTMVKSLND
jgi:hypothetical protein